jgi:prepilin-type N-terminal cleavage/methylation domain-containing protein
MRRNAAFTLIEMLAVIGIMLVLMLAAFGTFSLFAERIGPDSAVATLQGILNGARSYAAANGVIAVVEFRNDPDKAQDGTYITVKYRGPGDNVQDAKEIRGTLPMPLRNQMFVIRGLPGNFPKGDAIAVGDPRTMTDAQFANAVRDWKEHEQKALDAVNSFALQSGNVRREIFYCQFDPQGYLLLDPPDKTMRDCTVVRVIGGRVGQYEFVPLNAFSGTRLVFE